MYICGIIAEYDPFHTGHAHQISAVRNMLGEDCAVISVMSGNWTQRGSASITDKFTRARLALMGGADLVLELPLPFAVSSAEWFARGGVSVLQATGIVTHLCFGSEAGDLPPLQKTAECLDSKEFSQALRVWIDQGMSFPSARQHAAADLIGPAADCLSLPNNNLGVEYLRALNLYGSAITPLTVPRQGAGHGEDPKEGYASASYLRTLLRSGRFDEAARYLPDGSPELLFSRPFSDPSLAERAILYRLRQIGLDELAALPDCGEGLSNRLYRATRQAASVEEVLTLTKSKRYPLARLRRILLWAYLGMTAADRPDSPSYLRLLGMNSTGRALLHQMKECCSLPILTKAAHVHSMSEDARRQFALDERAADLYALFFPDISPCGSEWTQGPVIL